MPPLALRVLTAHYNYRISRKAAMRRMDAPTPTEGDSPPDDTTALINRISELLLRSPDVPESFKDAVREPGPVRQLRILAEIALAKTEGSELFGTIKKRPN
jgi:hypothetical protein